MPEINATNNVSYGGNLINQKYSPLLNIVINNGDRAFYESIFDARIASLGNINAFPRKLNLYAKWPRVADLPPNQTDPPMIVNSSNRATWLAGLFDNMRRQGRLNGFTDPASFDSGPVPWFAPLRTGGRHCYIVVHHEEYDYYCTKMVDTLRQEPFDNVTIVGYKYLAQHPAWDIAGFGASRYAALAMGINLGYTEAWMVDDNVVNINGFPQTLNTVEAQLGANNLWAIGFRAATANNTLANLYGAVNFAANAYVIGDQNPGLLQQAVLWDLNRLKTNNVNMSPYFASSNEDVSLTNFLQANNYDEKVITPLAVIKLEPTNDPDNNGAGRVSNKLNRVLNILGNTESDLQIKNGVNPAVDLSDFVRNTILPNCLNPAQSTTTTRSRAVEQALALATARGWARANIFNPYNGFVGQKIERLNARRL